MARKIIPQNIFSGELTPRLYGRQDSEKYSGGLRTATNATLTAHGPIRRRVGTKFIKEVKTSANATRLIRFQFSRDTAYMLEMGNLYFRFYKDGAVLGAPFEVVHPYTTAQLFDVTYAQFGNDIYFAHPSHAPRKLTRAGDTDWTLTTIDFRPQATEELGEFPTTTLTPAATTGLGITFTAGATVFRGSDVGRRLVNDVGVGIANITALISQSQATCDITQDFPDTSTIASGDWKLDLSPIAELTSTETAEGFITNVTADKIGTTTLENTFSAADVGKYIIMNGGVMRIVKLNSESDVDCEILKSLTTDDESALWTLEDPAWSATRGFPRAVGLHEQRLWFASTDTQTQTLWGSESGIFESFGVGATDADAISVDISSGQVSQINWMIGTRDLILGTSGGENTVSSGSADALSPSSIKQQPRTYYGSNRQQPATIGEEIVFIQGSKRKIRSFRYDFGLDGYVGEDLTFLSEHITEDLIKTIAYAQEPDNLIFAVLENGDMLSGVYKRDQQTIGWCRHTTTGDFEDVQVISVGEVDEIWVIVKRTINSVTKRYIERFETGDGTSKIHGLSDSYLVHSDPMDITSITQADPGVVTCGTHGYSNEDKIKLIGVGGMVEVENTTFVVTNKTATTFELASNEAHTGIGPTLHKWTASGSGTDEYYLELLAGGDPSISSSIISVYEGDVIMTEATVGSLSAGEWDLGDNDSLGFTTLYVRLTGGEDPDIKGNGWVAYALGIDTTGFTAFTSGGSAHKLVSSISGLSHLEGETVTVRADGGTHDDVTVSSGSITLDTNYYQAVVGIPYTTTITLLDKEFDVGFGSMQGQASRIVRSILRVEDSIIPTVDGNRLPARSADMLMDVVPVLFSGDLVYESGTWGTNIRPTIIVSDPLPFQLSAIYIVVDGSVK